jgi:hypothetical protein
LVLVHPVSNGIVTKFGCLFAFLTISAVGLLAAIAIAGFTIWPWLTVSILKQLEYWNPKIPSTWDIFLPVVLINHY